MNAVPQLPTARSNAKSTMLEAVKGGNFDPDAWHVMDREDDSLISEEILNGAMSGAFVYNFDIAGTPVQGISVIGAAHLARKYGGLKHRIVATVEKRGGLFKFTSYPAEGSPMQVTASYVIELENDPDYYTAVVEIQDIKTGNSTQVERTELRFEKKRNGDYFERPNFQTIAQSKAYRNAVLRITPQDVQIQFKQECIRLGKSKDVTASVIDEARNGLLTMASTHALPFDRDAVFNLSMAQLNGLKEAAKAGKPAFVRAAEAAGLMQPAIESQPEQTKAPEKKAEPAKKAEAPKQQPRAATPEPQPAHDLETGEIHDGAGQGDEPGDSLFSE